jgi:hypothetical protein
MLAAALGGALMAPAGFAGEPAKDPHAGHGQAPAAASAPAVSAEEQKMMEAFMKAATPGKPHEHLMGRAGPWEATVTQWMDPAAPPQTSTAQVERTALLGGRVLQDRWAGMVMGMPFEGLGLSGYDNVSGKWWGTWSDNMGTGLMTSEGLCEAQRCVYWGSYVDPMTGQPAKSRSVATWKGDDDETMQMFMPGADGKEWKSMEIVMKRVKK